MEPTVFNLFQKSRTAEASPKKVDTFFFQITTDPHGAYLSTVDAKGNLVSVNHQDFAGPVRHLLKSLELTEERNNFVIDWEKPEQAVYLHEHPHLLHLLKACSNVQDQEGKQLIFSSGSAGMVLRLTDEPSTEKLKSEALLYNGNAYSNTFHLLTEDHALSAGTIYEIPPLGRSFHLAQAFNTSFNRRDVVLFLSLLYSNFEHIDLDWDNYSLAYAEQPLIAEPCLIFEKIDTDEMLYLRVAHSLPEMMPDTTSRYDISRLAQISDINRSISIRPVRMERAELLVEELDRLLAKVQRQLAKGSTYFYQDQTFLIEKELAASFIATALPDLLNNYQIFGAEKLKDYRIIAAPPKLNFQIGHGIDFLEGNASLQIEDQTIDLFDAIQQYQKQRYILLSDGSKAILNQGYVQRLERLFKKKGKKAQISFFDLPLIEDLIDERSQNKEFKRSRDIFEGFNQISQAKKQVPKLDAKLRPYQQYGYQWLRYLHEANLGGCLADDMGLGKTLQTIALLSAFYPGENKPSIIAMPRSLLHNWQLELKRFSPRIKSHIYYGPDRNLEEALQSNILLTTYAVLRNDIEQIKEIPFFYAVLDESQNIKNLETQTTKAALLLKADHRLALSGTPIENHLGELYSLFKFLNPAMFGALPQFTSDYLNPIQKDSDPLAAAMLRKKIYPFVLRRLKKEVLKDLPDKTEQTILVEMSEDQARFYEQRRRYYQELVQQEISENGIQKSQFVIFQALNELRQIATVPESLTDGRIASAKKEMLLDQLTEAVTNGHKCLVFVNFLAAIETIAEQLSELGIDYVTMSGATRDRQSLVDRFQNDPKCKVFIMTLKTGGSGLNLTAADMVFLYDPWWNVAAENQAIDRTHRIGQVNKVHAYRLIAEGTIEEKIRELQEVKQQLLENIIGSDGASLKNLSQSDIDFILGA